MKTAVCTKQEKFKECALALLLDPTYCPTSSLSDIFTSKNLKRES